MVTVSEGIRWCVHMAFVVFDNAYCIPSYLMLMLILLPLRFVRPRWYWAIEGHLFKVLLAHVGYWGWYTGFRVKEYGDDISRCYTSRCLVIANHQSTADVPTLMGALQNKGDIVQKLYWVLDTCFRITPFGWVSWVHGDYFIRQGKADRDKQVESFTKHLKEVYWQRDRKWIFIFPEGGFLYKRKESNHKYALENSLPHFEHVTLPRVGAVRTALLVAGPHALALNGNGLSKHQNSAGNGHASPTSYCREWDELCLQYLVDITIAYDAEAPSLLNLTAGNRPPCGVHLHYRCFPIKDLPHDERELKHYLYDRFAEKERMLAYFYANGAFPSSQGTRAIEYSTYKILVHHVYYLVLCAFHIWWIRGAVKWAACFF